MLMFLGIFGELVSLSGFIIEQYYVFLTHFTLLLLFVNFHALQPFYRFSVLQQLHLLLNDATR